MVDTEEIRRRLDASSWLGVGVIGLAVFALGVYQPALGRFPDPAVLRIVVAVAGGIVSVMGLSFWWDSRAEELARPPRPPPLRGRARELGIAPSFEVYRPGTDRPPALPPPPPDDDERSA